MGHGDSPTYSRSHRDRHSPNYRDRDRREKKRYRSKSRSRSRSRDRNDRDRNNRDRNDRDHKRRRSSPSNSSRSRSATPPEPPQQPNYREKRDRRGLGFERKEQNWDSKYREEINGHRGPRNDDRRQDKSDAFLEQQERFMEGLVDKNTTFH